MHDAKQETAHEAAKAKPAARRPSSPKMPIALVDELRLRIGSGEETIAAAARRLGRSETAIRRAVRGQEWHCLARSYKDASAPAVPARPTGGRPPSLGADAVRAIRAAKGEPRKAVAARYGVSPRHVSRIWAGDARLDVEDAVLS